MFIESLPDTVLHAQVEISDVLVPGLDVGGVDVEDEAVEEDGDEGDDRAGPDGQPDLPAPGWPPFLAHPPLLHLGPLTPPPPALGERGSWNFIR
jgi:hypothetical protein